MNNKEKKIIVGNWKMNPANLAEARGGVLAGATARPPNNHAPPGGGVCGRGGSPPAAPKTPPALPPNFADSSSNSPRLFFSPYYS